MTKRKRTTLDDKMGLALERSFRLAVTESRTHNYVSVKDRPANSGLSVIPDFIIRDANTGIVTILEVISNAKKS
jgi:hypothetical protein